MHLSACQCLSPGKSVNSVSACVMQKNDNSQRQEYRGPVLDKALALLNVLPGGQIMLDCEAFHGINACLSSMARTLLSAPDLNLLMPAQGLVLSGSRC